MRPSYLQLHQSGELARRVRAARGILSACDLCPRECAVDRTRDEKGFCAVGKRAVVASYNLHFGEEAPLVGDRGSGTVFFGNCNLGCVFCQNRDISHHCRDGVEAEPEELAGVMLELQNQGALNINLVTPSHVVPQILQALDMAAAHGLRLPLVYNCGGYDRVETLRLLDGVVDIYMPDLKIWDSDTAHELLGAGDYPEVAQKAAREMFRQVGDLELDGSGTAMRGLLVRHLVMPGGLAGTREWMRFLATEISSRTYVNVMDQYRPCGLAREHPAIARAITRDEYRRALDAARDQGIQRLDDPMDRAGALFKLLSRDS